MSVDVTFYVPIIPKGSPRPRAAAFGGHARVYVPKSAQDWKRQVALAAEPFMPRERLDEPLRVDALFLLERPKRLMRRKDPDGLVWHTSKPDRDNLDKAVLDALAPFWRDDTDVCVGTILKAYHAKDGRPGLVVRVRSASLFDPATMAQQLGLISPPKMDTARAAALPSGQEHVR